MFQYIFDLKRYKLSFLSCSYTWIVSKCEFCFYLKDMVAFSCCEYDGGEEEKHEMDIARERSWRGKFRRRGRVIRPGANRMDGKCPLTPLEVCKLFNCFTIVPVIEK